MTVDRAFALSNYTIVAIQNIQCLSLLCLPTQNITTLILHLEMYKVNGTVNVFITGIDYSSLFGNVIVLNNGK